MQARRFLVTGGSQGIGAAIVEHARKGGHEVVFTGRNEQLIEQVARKTGAHGLHADVSIADDNARTVEACRERMGGIDVLVNNAGVFEAHPIAETTYQEWQDAWRRTLDVNLTGAANVIWCALRHMPDGGRIVMVSSRGAFRGEPNHPAYGASKAGIVSLGQSLARSLGPRGISVTSVAPGFVETEMAEEALAGAGGVRRRAESPLGRVAAPEEIAAAVMFLASPEATMASGSVLDVNGASFLRM
jgi:3-oxoacyl-[acyl-carrier protein] reductase